jgi:hypothetical protein
VPVFEDVGSGVRHFGVEAAARSGLIVPVPGEVGVVQDRYGTHCAIALVPLDLGCGDGSFRHVEAGDLLHADEIEHAGTGFERLVSHHMVARLPLDRGVVALALLAVR